jgi:hypothetical protein
MGDQATSEFFKVVGPKRKTILMQSLKDVDGTITRDNQQIRKIGTIFYKELPTEPPRADESMDNVDKVLAYIDKTVTIEMNTRLCSPFTKAKLSIALYELSNESCPSEDYLKTMFFRAYWDTMGEGLCQAFQEIFHLSNVP